MPGRSWSEGSLTTGVLSHMFDACQRPSGDTTYIGQACCLAIDSSEICDRATALARRPDLTGGA